MNSFKMLKVFETCSGTKRQFKEILNWHTNRTHYWTKQKS